MAVEVQLIGKKQQNWLLDSSNCWKSLVITSWWQRAFLWTVLLVLNSSSLHPLLLGRGLKQKQALLSFWLHLWTSYLLFPALVFEWGRMAGGDTCCFPDSHALADLFFLFFPRKQTGLFLFHPALQVPLDEQEIQVWILFCRDGASSRIKQSATLVWALLAIQWKGWVIYLHI